MATNSISLSSIGQIAVNVHDVDKAVSFYRDTLGMRFLFQVPKMAFFDCGGVRLMLGIPEEQEFDHRASIIYYKVDDIKGAYSRLVDKGVKFRGQPHKVADLGDRGLWLAFFEDPDANVLALMSEVAKKPS